MPYFKATRLLRWPTLCGVFSSQSEMDRKACEASESILATERFLNHNEDAPDGIDSLLSELDKI